ICDRLTFFEELACLVQSHSRARDATQNECASRDAERCDFSLRWKLKQQIPNTPPVAQRYEEVGTTGPPRRAAVPPRRYKRFTRFFPMVRKKRRTFVEVITALALDCACHGGVNVAAAFLEDRS